MLNLHLLSPARRKVYSVIDSAKFDNFIMSVIVFNTLIMALTVFPAPTEWWLEFQRVANYVFCVIYTIEAGIKLFALHHHYFETAWNRFDFVCVVASIVGIILNDGFAVQSPATDVIRILRIARLFRLMRFLKELNRLFMCLLISIPKLGNVTAILVLFLILYSILGMSLFGTAAFPDDGTFDLHGNFRTFFRSFVTLFRASTGEAWNEIMHDLAKTDVDFFRGGEWCTPQSLFSSRDERVYEVLDSKCLIENPNACPGYAPTFSYFYCFFHIAHHLHGAQPRGGSHP
jgi:hypothetical protein